MLRIGSRFARVEPRRRVAAFMRGLLAGLPRANCWTIAEHAGDSDPRGMQRLLSQAVWDADSVRDDLRGYVTEHLGDPDAVLVVDETGDVKKGTCTVGVQRQYTGTAGRIENSQVAVYLTYAAPAGYAFIDRDLYLPRSWTGDPQRCATAGVPDNAVFATKLALARAMIGRALDAGTRPAGPRATRSTAPTRHCARTWPPAAWDTCWQWPGPTSSPPASGPARRSASLPGCRNRAGSDCPPGPAPRANAATTGPWSRSVTPPSPRTADRTGC